MSRMAPQNLGSPEFARYRWIVHPFLAVAAAGCYGDSLRVGAPVARTDSAGVTIVHSTEPARLLKPTDQAALVIGEAFGEPEYLLDDVAGALRLADGRIVIANCSPPLIRWYDEDGAFLVGHGRVGDGPGEYSDGGCRPFGLFRAGEDVEVWDHSPSRITRYDPTGEYVGVRTVDLRSLGPAGVLVGRLTAGYLTAYFPAGQDLGQGDMARETQELRTFDSAGRPGPIASTMPGRTFGMFEVSTSAGILRDMVPALFAPQGRAVAWRDRIVIASADGPELEILGLEGATQMLIRWDQPVVSVTEALLNDYAEERYPGGERARSREMLLERPHSAEARAYDDVRAGPDGNVWVRRARLPHATEQAWLGFAADGAWIAELSLPDAWEVLEITDEYVLVIVRDALDVERVALYEVGSG